MAGEPDVIGRDAPARSLPAWLRPVGVVLAVCVAIGWFVVSRDDDRARPAPAVAPPLEPIGGEPGRRCGPANADGLAWSAPSGAVQPDGRVVIWRIHLCNNGKRDMTVDSLRPLARAERNLSADQLMALNRHGIATDEGGPNPGPVRIRAGEQAAARTVSVILGCDQPSNVSGLSATYRVAGAEHRADMPARRPGVSPVELWCNEYRRGAQQAALPLLSDSAATVTRRGINIDIRVRLFNPNGLPVTLTGLTSPSPGVGVVNVSLVTLPPGGKAVVSAELFVESCARVFVDAPWQLSFTARTDGSAVQVAPVRLGPAAWQRAAVREVCPVALPLPATTSSPQLVVTGPRFRGGTASYQVTQIVRNESSRTLLLRAHPRSAPGMEYLRAEVIPGNQAAVGRTTGAPLTRWSMLPNTSVFVSYFYRLGEGTDPVCLAPPVDRFRAPTDATDTTGRPITVIEEPISPHVPRAWVGGWLIDSPASCAQPVRSGRAAPFLIFAGRADLSDDGKQVRYVLSLYGISGEPPATLTALRLVGAFAHLPMVTRSDLGAISNGERQDVIATTPIRCPEAGVPITLAVSYRTASESQPLPVLLDLTSPPVLAGQRC